MNRNKLAAIPTICSTIRPTIRTTTGLALAAVLLSYGCTKKTEPVEVVIALEETPAALSDATVLVDYSQAGAKPLIAGGDPACASIQPHIDMTFSDDGGGAMTIELSSGQGFSGPLDIAVCRVVPDAEGVTTDTINARLRVSLLTATGPDGRKVGDGRLARAGGASAASRAGSREPDGQAPIVGGIDPPRPRGASTPRQPAVPRGDGGREPEPSASAAARGSSPSPAARGGAGNVPTDPYEAVPETVDELLARRGTGTARRDATTVRSELDDKAAALAESRAEPGAPPAETNDEIEKDPTAITYDVQVGVTSGAGLLAALQFDVRFTGEGGWQGSAGGVVCSTHPQVALATYNDVGRGWLRAAMIDITGFDAVGPISTCRFQSNDTVTAGDFSVSVIDASTPDTGGDSTPDPFPQMGVTDIRAAN